MAVAGTGDGGTGAAVAGTAAAGTGDGGTGDVVAVTFATVGALVGGTAGTALGTTVGGAVVALAVGAELATGAFVGSEVAAVLAAVVGTFVAVANGAALADASACIAPALTVAANACCCSAANSASVGFWPQLASIPESSKNKRPSDRRCMLRAIALLSRHCVSSNRWSWAASKHNPRPHRNRFRCGQKLASPVSTRLRCTQCAA